MRVSLGQHVCNFINMQISSRLTNQKIFLPRFNLAKTNFRICQLIHRVGTVSCDSVLSSLCGSLSLSMKTERNIYPQPSDFMAEGFCQGSSPWFMGRLTGVWDDWCCHTATLPRPWASWSPRMSVEVQIPGLHAQTYWNRIPEFGTYGSAIVFQSHGWFWDL